MDPDPRTWLPQRFGRRNARSVRDPIVEPAWDGIRSLAFVRTRGATRLVDMDGEEFAAEYAEIASALMEATSEPAIIDGYLTDQATRSSVGLGPGPDPGPTPGQQVGQMLLGRTGSEFLRAGERPGVIPRRNPAVDALVGGGPVAFVAIDIVSLDGQSLLAVPLLERKRVLESVLREGDLVRRTPYVRMPATSFIATWRSVGFASIAFKAANSRYLPGQANDDWALAQIPRR